MGKAARALAVVAAWPVVSVTLLVVGVVAWSLSLAKDPCDCGCTDVLRDGECRDCARLQSRVNP